VHHEAVHPRLLDDAVVLQPADDDAGRDADTDVIKESR
jgi:hypothetical protein